MKYRMLYIVTIILIAFVFLMKQNSFAQKESFNEGAGINGGWKLMPVLASDTAAGKIPTLVFNTAARSFSGNTGCNSISGKISLNGDKLSFTEQELVTKNQCAGYNEEAFMSSMIKVNHYKIENGVLELMVDQTVLSKWVRKEPSKTPKTI